MSYRTQARRCRARFHGARDARRQGIHLSLADKLKDGPVVLYFYPAAFSSGFSVETHDFAEATDRLKALGASIIGVSSDKISVLHKFSTADCQSKFALAADRDLKVAKSFDAVLTSILGYADRASHVITPNGTIFYAYS